jgi:transcriptional regulator with XRE-family HTH domain
VGIAEEVGQAIRAKREELGVSQEELAKRIGKHVQMVHRYETGKANVSWAVLDAVAQALETSPLALFSDARMIDEIDVEQPRDDPWLRKMAVREGYRVYSQLPARRLPPKAYELVYDYTQKLAQAGLSADEMEEAERFLVDGAYNKLNAREPGEKSEDDLIMDIKAAWQFVREVVNRSGRKI